MSIYESIKSSIEFIDDNLENNIGVLDVANHVSYSQFYFSREFSRLTHISIYDYIMRRKISESYKYLIKSNSKIIDIAFKYGFKSHEVYTRAFKKVFGINPSEIKSTKHLSLYEPIDEEYLDFLCSLKVEVINENFPNSYFEGEPANELASDNSLLILLSDGSYCDYKYILKGNIKYKEDTSLSYELKNLKQIIRIYSKDINSAFRFFKNNYYDNEEIGSNYILLRNEKDYIDVIIPCK